MPTGSERGDDPNLHTLPDCIVASAAVRDRVWRQLSNFEMNNAHEPPFEQCLIEVARTPIA